MTSPKWAAAFVQGYPGPARIETQAREPQGPFALFGAPVYEEIVNTARFNFWFADHAFFKRGVFYRCMKNGRMFMGTSGNDDPARFRALGIPIMEWRIRGDHIVLCPNSPAYMERHRASDWVETTRATLKRYTDRPIRVRYKGDSKPLVRDLQKAWAVVTYRSNAAVEAILQGVPAFCTEPCAASIMASDDLTAIESPRKPDGREQWAARLANHQWTLEEIADGQLWDVLGNETAEHKS